MAELIQASAAALLAGAVASMGLGGGFVLMVYLTAILGMPQLTAQGVNLLFFLPIAAFSVILHTRNKLIEWKAIPLLCLAGIAGAIGGVQVAAALDEALLRKLFAGLLVFVGIRELFHKNPKKPEGE